MSLRRQASQSNVHESFSDVALLMLATFIFLLVVILISYKLANQDEVPRLKEEIAQLEMELRKERQKSQHMARSLDAMASMDISAQMDQALRAASLADGKGRKDFEIFIKELRDLPGDDIHLIVDATGSMHGVATFLIPVLRVIVVRSQKRLSANIVYFNIPAPVFTLPIGAENPDTNWEYRTLAEKTGGKMMHLVFR